MDSLRLCAAEDLIALLAPGFVAVQTLQGDAESISSALGRAVDDQLSVVDRGPVEAGTAHVELAARTFVEDETECVMDALRVINGAFEERRTATCTADVILLMQNLFEQVRGDGPARQATAAFLERLAAERPELKRVQIRIWLVDGQSAEGVSYGIQDVQGILSRVDFQQLGAVLPTMAGNHFALGGRAVSFPRAELLDYLGTRFALRVLEHEEGLSDELLPYASVAHECSDFIEADVARIVKDMELNDKGGPIIPTPAPPLLSPDDPVDVNLTRVHQCVDELVRGELDRVQDQLIRKRKIAVADLEQALGIRVKRCVDEEQGGIQMARAFLHVLRHSASPLVAGDQVETGKPRTLRQAFGVAFEFFDDVTQFDSSQRVTLSETEQEAAAQRRWVTTMELELHVAREKADKGEDGAAARAEALETKIESIHEAEVETKERLDELTRVVTAQDWDVQTNKREIEQRMLADIEVEASAARAEVESSAAEVEETRGRLRKAEQEFRDALAAMALRVVGLFFGLVVVGLLGVLLLPFVFGAAPLVAPLLGFIGTAFGAAFFKFWAIGSVVALVGYGIAQARKYLRLKRAIDDLTRELEAKKATLSFNLRQYWQAYSGLFTQRCDLIRYGHVFDTDRDLEEAVDTLSAGLESFRDELGRFRSQAAETVERFVLHSTATEFVVVQRPWVDDLVQKKSDLEDERSTTFFRSGHVLSEYFDKWQLDRSGVSAFSSDTREYCAREIFEDILSTGVIKAVKETRFDLAGTVMAAPLFLPVNTSTPPESLLVLLGPDAAFLRDATERIVPKPQVMEVAEDEQILLLRVAHGIELKNVTVLGMK